jgi:hypothetical protein
MEVGAAMVSADWVVLTSLWEVPTVGCKQHGDFISPLLFFKKGNEAKRSRKRVGTYKSAA